MESLLTCIVLCHGRAIAICLMLILGECDGTPMTWLTRQRGGSAEDEPKAVAVDLYDSIIIAGQHQGSAGNSNSWDGQPFTEFGDVAIVKYDASGVWQWTYVNGDTSVMQKATGVATFQEHIYVTGTHQDYSGAPYGLYQVLLWRIGPNGVRDWAIRHQALPIASGRGAVAEAIVVDSSGSFAYIAGKAEDSWDGQTNAGSGDALLMKFQLESGGATRLWTRFRGSSSEDYLRGLAVDQSFVYAAGHTKGSFDGQVKSGGASVSACLLIKYDTNGRWQWTRIRESTNGILAYGISLDVLDGGGTDLYVAGYAQGQIDNQQVVGAGSSVKKAVLIKYDSAGAWIWTRLGTSDDQDDDEFTAVYAQRRRIARVYGVGVENSARQFGDLGSSADMLMISYSDSGDLIWSETQGAGSAADGAVAVTMDSTGRIVIAGSTTGDMDGVNVGPGTSDFVFISAFDTTTTTTTTTTSTTTTLATTSTTPPITTTKAFASVQVESTASEYVQGTITLNVSRASEFMNEPEILSVLRRFISELLQVSDSWIQNIIVTVLPSRRLQVLGSNVEGSIPYTRAREMGELDLVTKSGVKIEFDVVIPPGGGTGQVTASILIERFERASLLEATEFINSVVQSGALGSSDYDVEVLVKKIANPSVNIPAPAPVPKSEEGPLLIIAIIVGAIVFALVSVLLTLVFYFKEKLKRRVPRKDRESKVNLMASFSDAQLLEPPAVITDESMESLSNYLVGTQSEFLSARLEDSEPRVFVSFNVGQRRFDAKNSGPGLFFAAAVIKALRDNDIPCYSLLPDAVGRGLELLALRDMQDKPCKLLLILETTALYTCRACLEHIHSAQISNINVMRLRFDEETADGDTHWLNIPSDDVQGLAMRTAVEANLLTHSTVPEDPNQTVLSVPGFLSAFAFDLKRHLIAEKSYANFAKLAKLEHDFSATPIVDTKKVVASASEMSTAVVNTSSGARLRTKTGKKRRKKRKSVSSEPGIHNSESAERPVQEVGELPQSRLLDEFEAPDLSCSPVAYGTARAQPEKDSNMISRTEPPSNWLRE